MFIEISDYNPQWRNEYKIIQAELKTLFAFPINHIGSTSVPELAAKPKIDVLVEVPHIDDILGYIDQLAQLGYEYRFRTWSRRCFFRKKTLSKINTAIHIHVVENTSFEKGLLLRFRDYLRLHHDIAKKYEDVKRHAAQIAKNDIIQYITMKQEIIQNIHTKALELKIEKPQPSYYMGISEINKKQILSSLHDNVCGYMAYSVFFNPIAKFRWLYDNTLVICTDIKNDTFNIVINADVNITIDDIIGYYKQKSLPFSCWTNSLMDKAKQLPNKLLKKGLKLGDKNIGMYVDLRKVQKQLSTPDNNNKTFIIKRVIGQQHMKEFCKFLQYQPAYDYYTTIPANAYSLTHHYEIYIAYVQGNPVTSCMLFFNAGVVGIYYLYTTPNERRKGYANQMLGWVFRYALQRGYPIVTLTAAHGKEALYEKHGFSQICEYQEYTHGK
jgi:GrpB-like predicted nucleotidyltransferase (UPF0157 family)/GNAT superfamily N-acetyltransferase